MKKIYFALACCLNICFSAYSQIVTHGFESPNITVGPTGTWAVHANDVPSAFFRLTINSSDVYAGNGAAEFTVPLPYPSGGVGSQLISPLFSVTSGITYQVSFWVKVKNGPMNLFLNIRPDQALYFGGPSSAFYQNINLSSTSYIKITTSFTASQTGSVAVGFMSVGPPPPVTTANSIYVDDIDIRQLIPTSVSSISAIEKKVVKKVFVSPSKQSIVIEFADDFSGNLEAQLLDLNGRIILSKELNVSGNNNILSFETAVRAKGIYFIRILGKNGYYSTHKVSF